MIKPSTIHEVYGEIIDGCVMLCFVKGSTFSQNAVMFTGELGKSLNYVERVNVVWDGRQDISIKLAGSSPGTGTRTRIRLSAKLPN